MTIYNLGQGIEELIHAPWLLPVCLAGHIDRVLVVTSFPLYR